MHISIPRRNRRPKEKEQLQVGQDLCKCRGRARVSSGRVGAVVVRILVLAKWAGLTSERQLVGGSGGNCYYFRRVPALCNRLEAAESCSEMGRSCLAPHEGQCMHTRVCLAHGYYLTYPTCLPTHRPTKLLSYLTTYLTTYLQTTYPSCAPQEPMKSHLGLSCPGLKSILYTPLLLLD